MNQVDPGTIGLAAIFFGLEVPVSCQYDLCTLALEWPPLTSPLLSARQADLTMHIAEHGQLDQPYT